jgi:Pyridoxamine 5'-phosphate oxidase
VTGHDGREVAWAELDRVRPDLATAGRELLYAFGVGLAFLSTVRRDGGPRVHPMCPVIHDGRLLAFLIPSPKARDLRRDPRYAMHSFPMEDNEDAFYLTGAAREVLDTGHRTEIEQLYRDERTHVPDLDLSGQSLVEFLIGMAMLTRTTGHGDPSPRHDIWRPSG